MKTLLAFFMILALTVTPVHAEELSAQDVIVPAMEVYSWFTISPLDVNGDVPSASGDKYRVLDDDLVVYENMLAVLQSCFSEELIEEIWAWGSYETVNGQLYGYYPGESPLERSIDPDISEVSYELVLETDTARIYTATVYCLSLDEPLLFEFIQEPTEDGHWVFTQFPFFW